MDHDCLIDDRYQLISILGKGGYGEVLKVFDTKKSSYLALKKDITLKGSVFEESLILSLLQGGKGIPKLYDSGKTSLFTYMTMELLQDSLFTAKKKNFFSEVQQELSIIFSQCLSRIEYIHSKGVIHRDIKPSQFLFGRKKRIYLIDFGISKKFLINGHHINSHNQCKFIGSCDYASINSHAGIRLSRRDDLESFFYTAVFMINGFLPWSHLKHSNNIERWKNIFNVKRDILQSSWFKSIPEELQILYNYVKALKFEMKPDYKYLQSLVLKIRHKNGRIFDNKILNRRKNKRITYEIDRLNKSNVSLRGKITKTQIDDINFEKFISCLKVPEENCKFNCFDSAKIQSVCTDDEETQKAVYPEFLNKRILF